MDAGKTQGLVQWINGLNKGCSPITTLSELYDGQLLLKLQYIIQNIEQDEAKLQVPLDRFHIIQEYLEDIYHINFPQIIDVNKIIYRKDEEEIAKVALLLLCVAVVLRSDNMNNITASVYNFELSMQLEVMELIEAVCSAYEADKPLRVDFSVLTKPLKQGATIQAPLVTNDNCEVFSNSPQPTGRASTGSFKEFMSPLLAGSISDSPIPFQSLSLSSPRVVKRIMAKEKESTRKAEYLVRQKNAEMRRLTLDLHSEKNHREDLQMDIDEKCKIIQTRDEQIKEFEYQTSVVRQLRQELEILNEEKSQYEMELQRLKKIISVNVTVKERNRALEEEVSQLVKQSQQQIEELRQLSDTKEENLDLRQREVYCQNRMSEQEDQLKQQQEELVSLSESKAFAEQRFSELQILYRAQKDSYEELLHTEKNEVMGESLGFITEKRVGELEDELERLKAEHKVKVEELELKNLSTENSLFENVKLTSNLKQEQEDLKETQKDYSDKMEALSHTNSDLTNQVGLKQSELDSLTSQLVQEKTDKSSLVEKLQTECEKLQNCQIECNSLQHTNQSLDSQYSTLLIKYNEKVKSMTENMSEERASFEDQVKEITVAKDSIFLQLKTFTDSQMMDLKQVLETKDVTISDMNITCTQLKELLSHQQQEAEIVKASLESDKESLHCQVTLLQEQGKTLENNVESQNADYLSLSEELQKTVEERDAAIVKYTQLKEEAESVKSSLESDKESLHCQVTLLQEQGKTLENNAESRLADYLSLSEELQKIVEERDATIVQCTQLKEHLSHQQREAESVKASLESDKESLHCQVTLLQEQGKTLENNAESRNADNLSLSEELQKTVEERDAAIVTYTQLKEEAESVKASLESDKESLHCQVTLLQELFQEQGKTLENNVESQNADYLSLSEELQKTVVERDTTIVQCTQLKELLSHQQREAESVKASLESDKESLHCQVTLLQEQGNTLENNAESRNADYLSLSEELQKTVVERDTTIVQCTQLKEHLSHQQREAESVKASLESDKESLHCQVTLLQEQGKTLENNAESRNADYLSLSEELQKTVEERDTAIVKCTQLKEHLSHQQREAEILKESLESDKDSLHCQVTLLQEQGKTLENNVDSQNADYLSLSEELQKTVEERDAAIVKCEKAMKLKEELTDESEKQTLLYKKELTSIKVKHSSELQVKEEEHVLVVQEMSQQHTELLITQASEQKATVKQLKEQILSLQQELEDRVNNGLQKDLELSTLSEKKEAEISLLNEKLTQVFQSTEDWRRKATVEFKTQELGHQQQLIKLKEEKEATAQSMKLNYEKQLSDIKLELEHQKSKFEKMSAESDNLHTSDNLNLKSSLETKLSEAHQKNRNEIKEMKKSQVAELDQLKVKHCNILAEQKTSYDNQLSEARNEIIERLNKERSLKDTEYQIKLASTEEEWRSKLLSNEEDLKSEIDRLTKEVSSYRLKEFEHESSHNKCVQQMDLEFKRKHDNLREELNEKCQKVDQLMAGRDSLQTELSKHTETIETLKRQLQDHQSQHNQSAAELHEKLKNIEAECQATELHYETKLGKLKEEAEAVYENNTELQDIHDSVTEELQEKNQELLSMKKLVEEKQASLSDLKTKILEQKNKYTKEMELKAMSMDTKINEFIASYEEREEQTRKEHDAYVSEFRSNMCSMEEAHREELRRVTEECEDRLQASAVDLDTQQCMYKSKLKAVNKERQQIGEELVEKKRVFDEKLGFLTNQVEIYARSQDCLKGDILQQEESRDMERKEASERVAMLQSQLEASKQHLKCQTENYTQQVKEYESSSKEKCTQYEYKIAELAEKINSLTKKGSKLEEQLNLSVAKSDKLQILVEKLKDRGSRLQSIVHELEVERLNVKKYREKFELLDSQFNPLQKRLQEEESNNKRLSHQVRSLEVQLSHAETQIADYQAQRDKAGTGIHPNFHAQTKPSSSSDEDFLDDSLDAHDRRHSSPHPNLPMPAAPYFLRSRHSSAGDMSQTSGGSSPLLSLDVEKSGPFEAITLTSSGMTPQGKTSSTIRQSEYGRPISIKSKLKGPSQSLRSLASLNSSLMSTASTESTRSANIPRGAGSLFSCEDEEDTGVDYQWNRLNELKRRNTLCLPHLKTAYPVETQAGDPKGNYSENVIRGQLSDACISLGTTRKRRPEVMLGDRSEFSVPVTRKSARHSTMDPVHTRQRPLSAEELTPRKSPRRSTRRRSKSASTPEASRNDTENNPNISVDPRRESLAFNIHNTPKGGRQGLRRQTGFVRKNIEPSKSSQIERRPLGDRNLLQTCL